MSRTYVNITAKYQELWHRSISFHYFFLNSISVILFVNKIPICNYGFKINTIKKIEEKNSREETSTSYRFISNSLVL